jgi:hypothetical protein
MSTEYKKLTFEKTMEFSVTGNFILSSGQHLPYLLFSWQCWGRSELFSMLIGKQLVTFWMSLLPLRSGSG